MAENLAFSVFPVFSVVPVRVCRGDGGGRIRLEIVFSSGYGMFPSVTWVGQHSWKAQGLLAPVKIYTPGNRVYSNVLKIQIIIRTDVKVMERASAGVRMCPAHTEGKADVIHFRRSATVKSIIGDGA